MEIKLGTNTVELLPGRAAFLPKSRSLVVADLHLGKSATFRKHGLAVPEGTTASDLSRLGRIITQTSARELIIAGDLVHSAAGLNETILNSLRDWLTEIAIPVTLTEGNHDSRSWLSRHELAFKTRPSLSLGDLRITHDPADLSADQAGIAGHLHPGVRIKESPRNSLRVAGFFVKNSCHLILPAFSEFTGIHPLKVTLHDQFYAEVNDRIAEIPSALISP